MAVMMYVFVSLDVWSLKFYPKVYCLVCEGTRDSLVYKDNMVS